MGQSDQKDWVLPGINVNAMDLEQQLVQHQNGPSISVARLLRFSSNGIVQGIVARGSNNQKRVFSAQIQMFHVFVWILLYKPYEQRIVG